MDLHFDGFSYSKSDDKNKIKVWRWFVNDERPGSNLFFLLSDEQEPAVSSDSDISLIMAMEVGLSDVELSTDPDCEEVKSWKKGNYQNILLLN